METKGLYGLAATSALAAYLLSATIGCSAQNQAQNVKKTGLGVVAKEQKDILNGAKKTIDDILKDIDNGVLSPVGYEFISILELFDGDYKNAIKNINTFDEVYKNSLKENGLAIKNPTTDERIRILKKGFNSMIIDFGLELKETYLGIEGLHEIGENSGKKKKGDCDITSDILILPTLLKLGYKLEVIILPGHEMLKWPGQNGEQDIYFESVTGEVLTKGEVMGRYDVNEDDMKKGVCFRGLEKPEMIALYFTRIGQFFQSSKVNNDEYAKRNYRRAIHANAGFIPAYIGLVNILTAEDRLQEASDVADNLLKERGDYYLCYLISGSAKLAAGKEKGALEDFNKAKELRPDKKAIDDIVEFVENDIFRKNN